MKKDLLYLIGSIVIYALISYIGNLLSDIVGITNLFNAILYILLVISSIIIFKKSNRLDYYGLSSIKGLNHKKLLYYIPLFLIACTNLLKGINISVSIIQFVLISICMICVAYFEEIIFRSMLMKLIMNKNSLIALFISSILFGVLHLFNLFGTNASIIVILIQSLYAIASGFLYSSIFYKTKNIIPAIGGHALLNFLNIFLPETLLVSDQIIGAIIIIVISVSYAIYILKNSKLNIL